MSTEASAAAARSPAREGPDVDDRKIRNEIGKAGPRLLATERRATNAIEAWLTATTPAQRPPRAVTDGIRRHVMVLGGVARRIDRLALTFKASDRDRDRTTKALRLRAQAWEAMGKSFTAPDRATAQAARGLAKLRFRQAEAATDRAWKSIGIKV